MVFIIWYIYAMGRNIPNKYHERKNGMNRRNKYEKLLTTIEEQVDKLPLNAKFTLKELFAEEEWEKLTVGERRGLGLVYKGMLDKGLISSVGYFEEDTTYHTHYYRRIK